MPHTVRFVPDRGYIEVTLSGHVDLAGAEAALAALAEAGRMHPGLPVLADTRTAEYDLTATEVYRLASEAADTGLVRVRWALVNRPQQDFDRGALFKELSGHRGMDVGVFRDVDEARGWLLR